MGHGPLLPRIRYCENKLGCEQRIEHVKRVFVEEIEPYFLKPYLSDIKGVEVTLQL